MGKMFIVVFLLVSALFIFSSPSFAQECDPPGSQCYACDTNWCSNGDACAAGHSYCVWDPEGNYCGPCEEEFNNCSSQCQTCDTGSICKTYWGPNFCCPPGPGNSVCNYKMGCKWDNSGGNCICPSSNDAPTCGWVIDRISQGHPCNWKSECCVPPSLPPPSCNYNRDYNECNSRCNGTNYPPDHLVHVTEYTNPSGNVCRYDCNDLGRIPGQCGVPGNTQLYSCSGTSCVPDANGEYTDPNCGGACTAPPAPQKYSCSGSSCIVDANGPYTASNCNNACSAPPGGCSVGWTLSNENPQPSSNIQVKVRGLSDPQGWQNIRLTLDGSNTGNLAWPPENPWPTFVYNNVPSGSSGGHTLEFRTNNGSRSCAPTKTFTTQNPCDSNYYNDKTHVCYFAGTNPDAGNFLSQHDDPISFEHDWGTGQVNSTGRSDQVSAIWRGKVNFTSGSYIFHARSDDGVRLDLEGYGTIIPRSGAPNSWVDQGPTTHDSAAVNLPAGYRNITLRWYENGGGAYIKLWWDKQPPQNLSVNKPSCSDTAYPVTLNWQNTNNVLWADVDPDGDWGDKFYNKDVGNQTSTSAPSGFNGAAGLTGPMPNFNPGQTYFWRLWNGSTQTYGGGWSVPLCLGAWIQTIGGDVHSNGKIRWGGGP